MDMVAGTGMMSMLLLVAAFERERGSSWWFRCVSAAMQSPTRCVRVSYASS
jgi:hypothetical protein